MSKQIKFLELLNVTVSYDKSEFRINGLSLEIYKGEFIVLLGHTGSGKTTILNTIAGFKELNQGDLYINGNKMNDLSVKDRNIGVIFQEENLFPHLSVYKNLEFGLKIRKTPRKEIAPAINNALSTVGYHDDFNKNSKNISGGQKQKVALARLLLRNADLWLLDEPFSNLDPITRSEFRILFKEIQKQQKITTIYVTHDAQEALFLADRIIVIKQGEVIQFDVPEFIYDKPKDIYIAEFMDYPPDNFFKATVIEQGRENVLFFPELGKKISVNSNLLLNHTYVVGIRPQYFELAQNEDFSLKCQILDFEIKGIYTICKLKIKDKSFYAQFDRRTVILKPSEIIEVTFSTKDIIIFNNENQNMHYNT